MALDDNSTSQRIATALERIADALESRPTDESVVKGTDLEFQLEMKYFRDLPLQTVNKLLREVSSFDQLLDYIAKDKLLEIRGIGSKGIQEIIKVAGAMKKEGVW